MTRSPRLTLPKKSNNNNNPNNKSSSYNFSSNISNNPSKLNTRQITSHLSKFTDKDIAKKQQSCKKTICEEEKKQQSPMPLSNIENQQQQQQQLLKTSLVKETEEESRQPSPGLTCVVDDMSICCSHSHFLQDKGEIASSSFKNHRYSRRLSLPTQLQDPLSLIHGLGGDNYAPSNGSCSDSTTITTSTRAIDIQETRTNDSTSQNKSHNNNNQSCNSTKKLTRSHHPNSSHKKNIKDTTPCSPPPLIGNSVTGSHRGLSSGDDSHPSSHCIDFSLLPSQLDSNNNNNNNNNSSSNNNNSKNLCSSSSSICSTSSSTTNSGATFNPALTNTSVHSKRSFANSSSYCLAVDHQPVPASQNIEVQRSSSAHHDSSRTSQKLEIPDLDILAVSRTNQNKYTSCASNHQLRQGHWPQQQPKQSCALEPFIYSGPVPSTVNNNISNMVNSSHSSSSSYHHHHSSTGIGSEQPAPQAKHQDKTPVVSNKVLSQASSSSFFMQQTQSQSPKQPSMVSSPWHSVAATSVVSSPVHGGEVRRSSSFHSSLPPHSRQQQQSLHRSHSQQVQYYYPEELSLVEQRQEPSPFSSPSSSSTTLVAPASLMGGHLAGPSTHYRAAAAVGAGTSDVYSNGQSQQQTNASYLAPTSSMSYAAKMQMSMPLSMAPSPPPPPPPPRHLSSSVSTGQHPQFQYSGGASKATGGATRSRSGSASGLSMPSPEHRASAGPRIPLSPKSNASVRSNLQQQHQHSSNAVNGPQSSSSMSFRNHLHSSSKQHMVPNSPGHHSRSHHHASSSSSRPSPEVLKTLLRKKACLYEPGTSRAIALITWLVGRNLALTLGYFSRQRLQAGVHAVVANKIDSGMITRTKVNRCMQIILNSCFHYIIPRPDGTEENGEAFRQSFMQTVEDDTHLLKSLPSPWDDLDITVAENMVFCDEDEEDDDHAHHREDVKKSKDAKGSGKSSAKTVNESKKGGKKDAKFKHGSGKYESDNDDASIAQHDSSSSVGQSKRLVLLCFNENVRSAEDVLRCHNDFIRDAAISSNLFLTSEDWRYFFSRKDDDGSQTSATVDSTTSSNAAMYSSPMIKGTEGCDIPYLSFDIPVEVTDCLAFKDSISEPWGKSADILGQMNSNELAKFRTTWCCKRYEHDVKLCRFAHVTENKGWLRRDPTVYQYTDQLCPQTTIIKSDDSILKGCHINACKNGILCKFSHSQEEVDYHPRRYKSKVCESCKGGVGSSICRPCLLLDICPNSHPNQPGHHRLNRRRGDSFSRGKASLKLNTISDTDVGDQIRTPGGSPIIYLSPAPISDFDKAFQFAGLQSLFRRNCTVHYASHCGVKGMKYTLFNNDCGITDPLFRPGRGNDSFSLYSD